MFCGFWKDQRKIGAVRELEADWKYYDAADDEGEVQCDIPVWRSHGKIKEPRANVMAISWKLDLQATTWRRRYMD
ncbi:unnamed protein product [Sphagnum jensenii]|uniref:Uncharacterized protein n=1 Tax=Sphagnum jensenii TaxID=128206 RepID=A0ABP0X0H0_9BRYO